MFRSSTTFWSPLLDWIPSNLTQPSQESTQSWNPGEKMKMIFLGQIWQNYFWLSASLHKYIWHSLFILYSSLSLIHVLTARRHVDEINFTLPNLSAAPMWFLTCMNISVMFDFIVQTISQLGNTAATLPQDKAKSTVVKMTK